jgi:hypothetical protein
MPWFDGMTDAQIHLAIINRTAPGAGVPGGVVEVPRGWLGRCRLPLPAAPRPETGNADEPEDWPEGKL